MDKKFEEIFLQELKNINNELKNLNSRFDWLETRFDWLETRFDSLENKVDDLKDEFRDFSYNQELEHQATRKLINQAFESINENILYQEKVNRIEKLLSKSRIN